MNHPAATAQLDTPLRLIARWDGRAVGGVRVKNRRPRAAALLVGRSPDEAVALAPRLFALCGRAQGVAARLAAAAARGAPPPAGEEAAADERTVAAEAAAEHLWRLCLDWPALLGFAPRRARFAELHRFLTRPLDAPAAAAAAGRVREAIERELLPGFFELGDGAEDVDAFAARCRRGGGAVGEALAALLARGPSHAAPISLLPPISARGWVRNTPSGDWDAFAAAPRWHGAPAETGALVLAADSPAVAGLRAAGHGVAARLLAKVAALADCAERLGGRAATPLADACAAGEGVGLARVSTARGVLLHRVRVEDGRIADYALCAPTEWNFHPEGPFVGEAEGPAADRATAALRLSALALALDPCVGYAVELEEAADA